MPEFHTFTLQEQLQTLFSTSLNLYLADREFVSQSFQQVLMGSSRNWSRIKAIQATFLAAVNDILAAAVEAEEIPEQVFEGLIGQLSVLSPIGWETHRMVLRTPMCSSIAGWTWPAPCSRPVWPIKFSLWLSSYSKPTCWAGWNSSSTP